MVSEVIELSFGGGGKRARAALPLSCFTRKAGIRAKEGDGEGDHATDRKARWTGTREGSGRITSFNVGGGERWTFFCRVPFGETSPSAHSLPFYSRSGHFSAQKPVANSL